MRKPISVKNFFLVAATGEMVAKTSVGDLAAKKAAIQREGKRRGVWELTNLLYDTFSILVLKDPTATTLVQLRYLQYSQANGKGRGMECCWANGKGRGKYLQCWYSTIYNIYRYKG